MQKRSGATLVVIHNAVPDGNSRGAGALPQAGAVAPGEQAEGVVVHRGVAAQLRHAAAIALQHACEGMNNCFKLQIEATKPTFAYLKTHVAAQLCRAAAVALQHDRQ